MGGNDWASPVAAQKSFGETFGEARAATVLSGIPSPTGRLRGQRPQLQKIQRRNAGAGGEAATVAGDDGPGFHTWPSGHIPQNTAPNPLLRIRSTAKKTFGEAFGAATGVSDPRLQKIRIRNDYAGKFTSRRAPLTDGVGSVLDREDNSLSDEV